MSGSDNPNGDQTSRHFNWSMEALMGWAMHSYVLFLSQPKVPVGLSLGIHSDTDADAFALLPDRGTSSRAIYGVPGVNVGSRGGICGGASNEGRCKCGGGVSYSDRAEGADPDCWDNDEPGQNPGFVIKWIPRNHAPRAT